MQHSPSLWQKLMAGACFSCALLVPQLTAAQDVPPPMPTQITTIENALPSAAPQGENADTTDEGNVSLNWQGSLMFPQKDVDDLVTIYRAYLASIANSSEEETNTVDDDVAKQTLERLAGIQEQEAVDPEIYNFALNSILYNHSRDWSIWVNGKRRSRKEAMEGFSIGSSNVKVSRVGKDQITYVWEPQGSSFDVVQSRWDAKQQRKADKVQSPQIAAGDQVAIDGIGQKVTVTLRPNQTFMSEHMSVMEGTRSLQKTPAAADSPPAGSVPAETGVGNSLEPISEEMPGNDMESPAAPMMDDGMENDMNDNFVDPNEVPLYESGMEPGM